MAECAAGFVKITSGYCKLSHLYFVLGGRENVLCLGSTELMQSCAGVLALMAMST